MFVLVVVVCVLCCCVWGVFCGVWCVFVVVCLWLFVLLGGCVWVGGGLGGFWGDVAVGGLGGVWLVRRLRLELSLLWLLWNVWGASVKPYWGGWSVGCVELGGLVWAASRGGCVSRLNVRGGWWGMALGEFGIPRVIPHELCHAAVSLVVQSGANVRAVQWVLAYVSAAMTLDVCADLFDGDLGVLA